MGKGDSRSRRGKIYQGSFGKSRPKKPARLTKKKVVVKKPAASSAGITKRGK